MKKDFLLNKLPKLIDNLKSDTTANFGLMTPQHMLEHLSYTIKSSTKRNGEPEVPPSEGQMKFQKFIEKGTILQHRPSDKTKDDLPALHYKSFEEAKEQLKTAVKRFYDHYEGNPEFIAYNKWAGEMKFDQFELMHYQHCRYHAWQFGLVETYP